MGVVRIFAAITLLLFAVVISVFLWSLFSPQAGRMDAYASARIRRLCGFTRPCSVRIGDLFQGDWDTFYEFGAAVPQADIDATLHSTLVRRIDGKRTLVLTRAGRIVATENAAFGAERPFDGEIEFEDERHREQHIVRYSRNTPLRVTSFSTEPIAGGNGIFYVLSINTDNESGPAEEA